MIYANMAVTERSPFFVQNCMLRRRIGVTAKKNRGVLIQQESALLCINVTL